jgi:hypothetical protein
LNGWEECWCDFGDGEGRADALEGGAVVVDVGGLLGRRAGGERIDGGNGCRGRLVRWGGVGWGPCFVVELLEAALAE